MRLIQVYDINGGELGLYETKRQDDLEVIEKEIQLAFEQNDYDQVNADFSLEKNGLTRTFVDEVYLD